MNVFKRVLAIVHSMPPLSVCLSVCHTLEPHQTIGFRVAANSEDFVILACTVLMGLQSVTDTQTARQTDALAIAKTREAFCCRA